MTSATQVTFDVPETHAERFHRELRWFTGHLGEEMAGWTYAPPEGPDSPLEIAEQVRALARLLEELGPHELRLPHGFPVTLPRGVANDLVRQLIENCCTYAFGEFWNEEADSFDLDSLFDHMSWVGFLDATRTEIAD